MRPVRVAGGLSAPPVVGMGPSNNGLAWATRPGTTAMAPAAAATLNRSRRVTSAIAASPLIYDPLVAPIGPRRSEGRHGSVEPTVKQGFRRAEQSLSSSSLRFSHQ